MEKVISEWENKYETQLKNAFILLTSNEIEADRSSAYTYLL